MDVKDIIHSLIEQKIAEEKYLEESLDEVVITKHGRKFSNVKFFETDKETNAFLEKNPQYGVLHTDKDGVYVALNKDSGKPVK
jgi:hypothetical protein